MGCGSSSRATSSDRTGGHSKSYTQIINDKCPHIRLDHNDTPRKLKIEGADFSYELTYCYVSQRGYYPNALSKANQDSYVICENFLEPNCHFFGVFDGHGEYGDFCSHFAADQVPLLLERELQSASGVASFEDKNMEEIYGAAFVKTNKMMHKANFDDELSGTTAITVFVKGDCLYVANVGDSRAIIASKGDDGKLRSFPLSVDQTPFRKDERERLKKKGARIMTLDQIEGNEPIHENWGTELGDEIDEASGDPPRVWDHTLERPGCAFTRSIGDAHAELCGVFAVPEILVWRITPKDQFVVIASDGVFEFLTSQAVVDMIEKFSNPLDAAKHVVAEAYRLWLTYDDRTDDITIIILCFGNIVRLDTGKVTHSKSTEPRPQSNTLTNIESKPVRRAMTKAKRKVISEAFTEEDKNFRLQDHATPKTPAEMSRIEEMVRANFMFQNLSSQQKQQIFQVMKLRYVSAGELIIREGDQGDEMYIIDSGEFDVSKRNDEGVSQNIFTYTTSGAAFGELSLMYGKPRAASIRAKTDGRLWSIGRQAFRAVLMKRRDSSLLKLLKALPIFADLSFPKLQRLADMTTEETFAAGEIIASADTPSVDKWVLFVIVEGTTRIVLADKSKKPKTRQEGLSFGAVELRTGVARVEAMDAVKIARISERAFVEIMGDTQDSAILNMQRSPRMVRQGSIWSVPEKLQLRQVQSRDELKLIAPTVLIGDFAYVGTFQYNDDTYSIKVVAKKNAQANRMDQNILNERKFLAVLQGASPYIPKVTFTFQDAVTVMLAYNENFECDLAYAVLNNLIPDNAKQHYSACIYSALSCLHENGLMHRFLNPCSVYISDRGVPMLTDLRYAKRMDGSKAFTICGDPLYFSPEIVGHQGYDYSSDLWALGVLIYEIYEGTTPFGNADTEETALFKAITGYKNGKLEFSDRTPESAREIIKGLLDCRPMERIGYKDTAEVHDHAYFAGVSWKAIPPHNLNIECTIDTASIFQESALEPFSSSVFDQF